MLGWGCTGLPHLGSLASSTGSEVAELQVLSPPLRHEYKMTPFKIGKESAD